MVNRGDLVKRVSYQLTRAKRSNATVGDLFATSIRPEPEKEQKMSIGKKLWSAMALGFASIASLHASDVGVDINAASYDFESQPDDPSIILNMGTKVGYVRTESDSFEYWGYEGFDFGDGATHLTVRVASATQGGTLHVRWGNHYNPGLTIATVEIPNTGGWNSFQDITVPVNQLVIDWLGNGRSLFFVVEQDGNSNFLFDVESFRFDKVDTDVTINAADFDNESYPSDDTIVRNMGTKVGYIQNGSWIRFFDFNFGSGASSLSVNASSASSGGTLYITSQAPYGFSAANFIASIDVSNTGGWNTFREYATNLDLPVEGQVNTLYLTFEGDSEYLFDVQSFRFNSERISQVGLEIDAGSFDGESAPDDLDTIRKLGRGVGFVKADNSFEYWTYNGFEFGDGATSLTVRASSATQGGTLYVRLANHYNPGLTVATVEIPNTGGWDSFQEFTVPVDQDVISQFNGRTLFFVVTDEKGYDYQFDIESFRFDNN